MSIQLPPQQNYPYGMLQAGRTKNAGGKRQITKLAYKATSCVTTTVSFF